MPQRNRDRGSTHRAIACSHIEARAKNATGPVYRSVAAATTFAAPLTRQSERLSASQVQTESCAKLNPGCLHWHRVHLTPGLVCRQNSLHNFLKRLVTTEPIGPEYSNLHPPNVQANLATPRGGSWLQRCALTVQSSWPLSSTRSFAQVRHPHNRLLQRQAPREVIRQPPAGKAVRHRCLPRCQIAAPAQLTELPGGPAAVRARWAPSRPQLHAGAPTPRPHPGWRAGRPRCRLPAANPAGARLCAVH